MLDLAARLERRGCQPIPLTEAIYTRTPGGRLILVLFAELEAHLARERTRPAARLARERGELWGRRSQWRDPGHVRRVQAILRDKRLPRTEIAKTLGIDVSTLYKWFPGADLEDYRGIPTEVSVWGSLKRLRLGRAGPAGSRPEAPLAGGAPVHVTVAGGVCRSPRVGRPRPKTR